MLAGDLQVQAYSATFDGPTAFSLPALPQQLQALSQTGGADPTGDGLARTNTTSAVVGELTASCTPPQAERAGRATATQHYADLAGLASPHARRQALPSSPRPFPFRRLRRRDSATTARAVGPDGPGHAAGRHPGLARAGRRRPPG